jgi:hypothetical protein
LWTTLYGYPGGLVAKAGKIIGLISPVLAVGIVTLMLFGAGYSYQSASCKASYGHESSEACAYEPGTMTAFRFALEEGNHAWFFWSGFVVVVCLIAAAGAFAGRAAPVWICAVALWVVAVLGMWSIGLFVLPLSLVLFVSAALLTVARYESRGA